MVYSTDTLKLDLLGLTKDGSPLMSSLGAIEWECQDIRTSHPLPFRSGAPFHTNNLVSLTEQQSFTDRERKGAELGFF